MNGGYIIHSVKKGNIYFLALLGLFMGMGCWIWRVDPLVFGRFLANVNPMLVVLLSGVTGVACLGILRRRSGLAPFQLLTAGSALLPATGAMVFGVIVIAIDLIFRLPEDLNVAFPAALLFYPAIGFVAEIVFHIMPFTIVLLASRSLWGPLIISAFCEPLYQIFFMHSTGQYSYLTLTVIGIHIFLFSLFQLIIFIRHGFFHMYLVRLFYYLIWHVGWAYVRLQIVFT